MIKFIDIETGNLYNGLAPYIHWFPNQQSTGLIYTHKICFVSKFEQVSIDLDSQIFHIINSGALDENHYNNYSSILWDDRWGAYASTGKVVSNDLYVHMLYISAQSENEGEYMTNITIFEEDEQYNIKVGADFYSENESLYINLSNMGVELPSAIQSAIYDVNVYEGAKDNITLNRKMKELISNYWEVIANKGNYTSLLNSLKWFEWGEVLGLKELWKRDEFGTLRYDVRDLCSLLEHKYNGSYEGFHKTTYLALYLAMHIINDEMDYEGNPTLSDLVTKWSKEDLMLKMCLLGNFYETYFMPIHLDLIHATIENVVFTNTIKIVNGGICERQDYIYQTDSIKCNIKDEQVFTIGNVKCQSGPSTMFCKKWNGETEYNQMYIMGVEDVCEFPDASEESPIPDTDLKSFYSQLYEGIGTIVNFECEVELEEGDFIVESKLVIGDKYSTDYTLNNTGKINFNILLQKIGRHQINIQFRTAGANIYNKQLHINVIDVTGMRLKVYKVRHYAFTDDEKNRLSVNKYQFSRCSMNGKNNTPVVQYIYPSSNMTSGIALNNILVLRGDYVNDEDLNNHYYISKKDTTDQVYTICVSKKYRFKPESCAFYKKIKDNIYRNDYGYFPEFHYLVELDGEIESDFHVYNTETIAVIPELPLGLEMIDEMDWEFTNITKNETYKFPYISEPFVSSNNKQILPNGYYDILFRFRLGEEWHEMKFNSAFKKV